MLGTSTFAFAAIAVASLARSPQTEGVRLVWTFEPSAKSAMISSPALDEHCIYVAVIEGSGFSDHGVVYCLNRESGKELWRFDNDGAMQRVFSSPYLDGGRLYIGEGLHENRGCRLYCLDAASGRKLWDFETASHTESSPRVDDGKVYVGAGDDGIYCLDARTGAERWHFRENLHVDASPTLRGKSLYVGSGVSRTQKETQVLCLNADSGRVLWRHATRLPAWGSPCVSGNRVFFGLGNGRYDRSDERPAGAVLCVDADVGKEIWHYDVDDAVLMAPAVDGDLVYFGSRDHHCYCVQQDNGQLRWKADLGSPVVARLIAGDNRTYAAASGGIVCRLDGRGGAPIWVFDLAEFTHSRVTLFAAPAKHDRRLYVAASLESTLGSQAVLYCLEDAELPTKAAGR